MTEVMYNPEVVASPDSTVQEQHPDHVSVKLEHQSFEVHYVDVKSEPQSPDVVSGQNDSCTPSLKEVSKRTGTRPDYVRHFKSPFSYIEMIMLTIESNPNIMMTFKNIISFMSNSFHYLRGDYEGWKNSVRHNLSFNECFKKVLRCPDKPYGKDNFWIINQNCKHCNYSRSQNYLNQLRVRYMQYVQEVVETIDPTFQQQILNFQLQLASSINLDRHKTISPKASSDTMSPIKHQYYTHRIANLVSSQDSKTDDLSLQELSSPVNQSYVNTTDKIKNSSEDAASPEDIHELEYISRMPNSVVFPNDVQDDDIDVETVDDSSLQELPSPVNEGFGTNEEQSSPRDAANPESQIYHQVHYSEHVPMSVGLPNAIPVHILQQVSETVDASLTSLPSAVNRCFNSANKSSPQDAANQGGQLYPKIEYSYHRPVHVSFPKAMHIQDVSETVKSSLQQLPSPNNCFQNITNITKSSQQLATGTVSPVGHVYPSCTPVQDVSGTVDSSLLQQLPYPVTQHFVNSIARETTSSPQAVQMCSVGNHQYEHPQQYEHPHQYEQPPQMSMPIDLTNPKKMTRSESCPMPRDSLNSQKRVAMDDEQPLDLSVKKLKTSPSDAVKIGNNAFNRSSPLSSRNNGPCSKDAHVGSHCTCSYLQDARSYSHDVHNCSPRIMCTNSRIQIMDNPRHCHINYKNNSMAIRMYEYDKDGNVRLVQNIGDPRRPIYILSKPRVYRPSTKDTVGLPTRDSNAPCGIANVRQCAPTSTVGDRRI